ncbi:MAG TPA: TetR/AcrR family transcriptional regulator [Candidatus Dormibacteraeota bacterium]
MDPLARVTVSSEVTPRRRPGRPRLEGPSPEYLQRREEIMVAAAEVFRAKGYEAGTLEDVATSLDLRRASLYYYFGSKAQLLSALCERTMGMILRIAEDIERVDDPAERLAAMLRLHTGMVAREQGLFTVFFDERGSLADQERARDFERRYLRHLVGTVEAAVSAGLLPPTDPYLTALALLGMMSWIYKWYEPGRHDAEAYARTCEALLLGPRAGR